MTDRRAFLAGAAVSPLAMCLLGRAPEPKSSHSETTWFINGWPYLVKGWDRRQWAALPEDDRPGNATPFGDGWIVINAPPDMPASFTFTPRESRAIREAGAKLGISF